MKKIISIAIGVMLLFSVVPQVSAATTVSGRVTSISCGSSGMLTITSMVGIVRCKLSPSTSFIINGSPGECSDIKSGMTATVTGEQEVYTLNASRVVASGSGGGGGGEPQPTPFNIRGTIASTNCPSSITVNSSSGAISITVSNASITRNGGASSCSELEAGDTVSVSGTKTGNTWVANSVSASTPVTRFTLSGTIASLSCPDTISVSATNGVHSVNVSSARITLNGASSTCASLKIDDSVSITGTRINGELRAIIVSASREAEPPPDPEPIPVSISGVISSINCGSDTITVTTSFGNFTVSLPATFTKDGETATCASLVVGDLASATGIMVEGRLDATVASFDSAPGEPEPDPDPVPVTISGVISATNCANSTITVTTQNGSIEVSLPETFTKDGETATCTSLVVGDLAVATGFLVEGRLDATVASFDSAPGEPEPDPDPIPVTLPGVIISIDCTSNEIVITTANGDIIVSLPETLTKDGNNATCEELEVGDLGVVVGFLADGRMDAISATFDSTNPGDPEPPEEGPESWTGTIIAVDCQNMTVTILMADGSTITFNIEHAGIVSNLVPADCLTLTVGQTVKITGDKITDEIYIAHLVEVLTDDEGDDDDAGCDGPFSYIGVIISVRCGAGSEILVKIGDDEVGFDITGAVLEKDGYPITCSMLKVGMEVRIIGTCDPETGETTVTKIIITGQSDEEPGIEENTIKGDLRGTLCWQNLIIIIDENGKIINITITSETEIIVNGRPGTCYDLMPPMKITVIYKINEDGNKVAIKIIANTDAGNLPPGQGGGAGSGGGTPPPSPPPGGGSGGGGTPPPTPPPGGGGGSDPGSGSEDQSGADYQSVLTVESVSIETGIITAIDEYNAGKAMKIVLSDETQHFYKQRELDPKKISEGYLVKVTGIIGEKNEVKASQIELLPVSPQPITVSGKIVEVDKTTGWVRLKKITENITLFSVADEEGYLLINIDPTTTFDYKGKKLTLENLRAGVIMELEGTIDPINSVLSTSSISLSARQAIQTLKKGVIKDVFCDKKLLWIETSSDDAEGKYILIKIDEKTDISLEGKSATCTELVAGSSITVDGMLDPFDMYINATEISALKADGADDKLEGELMDIDTTRQTIWLRVTEEGKARFVMVKYNSQTTILAFGKKGTASDLSGAGQISVVGSADPSNEFIFNATTIESLGELQEDLTIVGSVVFADCDSNIIFVRTKDEVLRFQLTATTRIYQGETIATCGEIEVDSQIALVYDQKGTKTIVTKVKLPSAKTVIKLIIGMGYISIDGKNILIDAPPYIKDGTTMVPLRVITEQFGASLDWNAADKRITLRRGDDIIICRIGRKDAVVNGKSTEMLQAPEITNDRTMVPIRFMSEMFGAKVEWDGETKTVTIIM